MITIATQSLEIGPQTTASNGSSHCGLGQRLTVNRVAAKPRQKVGRGRPKRRYSALACTDGEP